eukprot:3549537-Pleurochrysis_carterae.AAC.3
MLNSSVALFCSIRSIDTYLRYSILCLLARLRHVHRELCARHVNAACWAWDKHGRLLRSALRGMKAHCAREKRPSA